MRRSLTLLLLCSLVVPAAAETPWSNSFTTNKLRLDFAPGQIQVMAKSDNQSWPSIELIGSPNVDPLNGMPWRSIPNYHLDLGYGQDGTMPTVLECAHLAETLMLMGASSPHRLRVELGSATSNIMVSTYAGGGMSPVRTNEIDSLVCTML